MDRESLSEPQAEDIQAEDALVDNIQAEDIRVDDARVEDIQVVDARVENIQAVDDHDSGRTSPAASVVEGDR